MPLTTPPILIVTVTSIETLAILGAFSASAANARQMLAGKVYYALGPCGGVPIFLVQSEAGAATPSGSLLTVDQAIPDLAPQVVILCGVTCGFRPETQALGELLIASQLTCYEPQKTTVHHGRTPRGDRVTVSARPLGYLRSAVLDWHDTPTHFGPILSGEKWVDDPAFRAELLETEPEAIGAETEGAGLYVAAHSTKTDWILVKAISRWPGGADDPATQQTAAANAARFIHHALQIVSWAAPAAASGTSTPPIDLIDLPTPANIFLGRQAELASLETHLTGHARPHILTLYGAPGQGKTTLARQAVERFASSWPGGILAISFENLPTRQDLVARLDEFLNIDPAQLPPDQAERRVLQTLARRPATLLVLDNAETLVDQLDANAPAAALAEFLQDRIPPTVTLFVTSRRRLGLPGEQTLELPGLTPAEGARLFQQSAPDQPATPADLARLETLSAQLEGHPLSLRLLGITYNNFGPDLPAFLRQFEHHLILANDKYKSLDHRQRSLFASIATSIQPLDTELKTLFFNLALFHAPFRPIDAAAIFDPTLHEQPEASGASDSYPLLQGGAGGDSSLSTHLYHLWQRGLLERQLHPTDPTQLELYHLLPPLRLYSEQTAPLPPEILPHFAQVYGDLIHWIWKDLDKGPTASLLARLSASDIERALEHTQDLARANYNHYLGYVEFRLGHPWKGKPRLEQALAWAYDHDQQLASSALNVLGLISNLTGQPQEALKYYQESLQIKKETGDRAWEATILNNIGGIYDAIGQRQEALKYFREALPIRQEVGDRVGEAATLNNIGAVYRAIGQPQEALKYYREALPIHQEVGDRAGEATTLNNIGLVYDDIGQPQEALKYYREVLPIRQEVGDRAGEATTLNNIGLVYDNIGQPQEALKYYREALPILKEVSNRFVEAVTLNNIGLVYYAIGQPQEALKYYREALPIRREVGNRAGEAITLNNIGGVYRAIGQPQEALKYYREALPIRQEVGDRAGEATTLNNMASLLISEGQNQQALDLFRQALKIFQEVDAVTSEAAILCNMASLLGTRLNDPAQALPLLRRSIELLKTSDLPQDATGRTLAQHESLLAKLEAQV
jgi:tetratricopeptide (TPR) repeat protein/nucleoside phosphorylase